MSIANYFIPYAVHLTIILVVILICFLKFQSLRKYRRKRNLLVYAVLAILVGLLAYETYNQFLGPAIVSYSVVGGNQFYAGQVNQFTVSCENLGMRETSFYLVLNSENASLLAENQQDYIQVNSTSIKIPFTLHSLHEKTTATVFFSINENVTSCAFYPNIERANYSPIVTGSTLRAECIWNAETNSYNLTVKPGPYA